MAPFDDSTDPALGAACNRLAAWVEPLPEGAMVDGASRLTERDLALILRHLYATRRDEPIAPSRPDEAAARHGRASVPLTAKE